MIALFVDNKFNVQIVKCISILFVCFKCSSKRAHRHGDLHTLLLNQILFLDGTVFALAFLTKMIFTKSYQIARVASP